MTVTGETDGEGRHALVAGGGTGGHVFPGLALAAELGRRRWKVSFVGRQGGLEERVATEQGLPFHALEAGPLLGASWTTRVRSVARVASGALAARRLVRAEGVDVVVGLGGYVSAPAVLGSRLARCPVLLFEPNAVSGIANRWLSRFAAEAAVAWDTSSETMSCRTIVTGVPVRSEFLTQPAAPPEGRPRLLVLGGSQGAQQINQVVPEALAVLDASLVGELEVLHQAGPENVEATEVAYREARPFLARLEVVPFLDDVAAALGRAGLVVSRAGAITLAEICAVGRAAVLIPLSIAAAHQEDNAAVLVEAGAAEALPRGGGAADLARQIESLLVSPERLAAMGAASRGLARRDATRRLADRVTNLTEGA